MSTLDLGTLTAKLAIDGAATATSQLGQFSGALDQAGTKAGTADQAITEVKASVAALGSSAANATTPLSALGGAASSAASPLAALAKAFPDLDAMVASLGATASATGAKLETLFNPPVTGLGTAASATATQVKDLKAKADDAGPSLARMAVAAASGAGSFTQMAAAAATGVGTLQAIRGAVSTITSFTSAIFDNADALVKMSDKTGISIDALQKFQFAGDASGNTIEQIARGVNLLQKNLEEGTSRVTGAVTALGLSAADLKTLSPENQFTAIASAIAKIQDPAKQAQLAMEIFGRAGAELLPTLKADLEGIGAAAWTMSTDNTLALNAAADAWKHFQRDAQSVAGNFLGNLILQLTVTGGIVSETQLDFQRLIDTAKSPGLLTGKAFDMGLPTEAQLHGMGVGISDIQKAIDLANKPARDFEEALVKLQGVLSGSDLLTKGREYEQVLAKIGGASILTTKETDDVVKVYTAIIQKYDQIGPAGAATVAHFQNLLAAIKPIGGGTADLTAALEKAGAEIASLSGDQFRQLTQAVQSGAFTMKQLEASSGLSATAMKLFKDQVSDTGKELKASQTIFDSYNKKVAELTTVLGEALKFDAPIAYVKAQFGTMIKAVVEDAALLGKDVPQVISDAFLAITIKDGADHLLKEFAKFGDDMNKQVKSDMGRVNAEIIKTLGVIVTADNATAVAQSKYLNQSLANEITNMEAIGGITKQSLEKRRELYVQEYQQEVILLKQKADEEKASLTSTGAEYNDAVAAIDAKTDAQIQLQAQKLNQSLTAMDNQTAFWSKKTLDSLSSAFSSLATVTGSAAGTIIGDVAAILGAMQTAEKAGASLAQGNYLAAATQGYTALQQSTASPSTSHNIAGGAATGATLGFEIAGPYGAIVGGLAGAIYGWLKSSSNTKFMEQVGRDWGVTITTTMADQIKKDASDLFHGSTQAASIFDISSLIGAAGGLNTANVDGFTTHLRDLFSMYQTGAFSASDAVHVLDTNWQAFVTAGTDSGGRLSAGLKDIIQLTDQYGLKSKEVTAYVQGQASAAITASNSVIAGLSSELPAWDATKKAMSDLDQGWKDYQATLSGVAKDSITEWNKYWGSGPGSKAQEYTTNLEQQARDAASAADELKNLGIIAMATFGAALKAGMTYGAALQAAAPGLDQLNQAYSDLGITAQDAGTKELLLQDQILKNSPTLIAAVDGLGTSMIALDNIGGLNVDTFGSMETTGMTMYTRLQAQVAALGGTTKDALIPMQGYLQDAAAEAAILNVPLDANTAQMIAQSKELGIWKDQGETPTQALTDGMNKVVTALNTIVARMGKIIGTTIPDKSFTVTQKNETSNGDGTGSGSGGLGFATGTRGKLIDFGPKGTLVTLHNKERVQTESEARAADARPNSVVDIVPHLMAQLATQNRQLAETQQLNDFFQSRFGPQLARNLRDNDQKATRRG